MENQHFHGKSAKGAFLHPETIKIALELLLFSHHGAISRVFLGFLYFSMKIMFSQKLETQFRTVPTTILYMFRKCLNVLNNHRYIEKLHETTKDLSSPLVGFQICEIDQIHRKSPKS